MNQADMPPSTVPGPQELGAAFSAALAAATEAIHRYRRTAEFGDGEPAARMGTEEDNALIALEAAAPLLAAPYQAAIAFLIGPADMNQLPAFAATVAAVSGRIDLTPRVAVAPAVHDIGVAYADALTAATRAVGEFRVPRDYGPGLGTLVNVGSDRRITEVVLAAATALLLAPFERAIIALAAQRDQQAATAERRRIELESFKKGEMLRFAQALHYAEGTVGPVEYLPDSCATCERAAELYERVVDEHDVAGLYKKER